MNDPCVRALPNAPVKVSANPDTSVTETQSRVNIKVSALVQQGLGVGAAQSSHLCSAVLQMWCLPFCLLALKNESQSWSAPVPAALPIPAYAAALPTAG